MSRWEEETYLDNGENVQQAYLNMLKKAGISDEIDAMLDMRSIEVRKMKKDIANKVFGSINVKEMPYDLQVQLTRAKLGMSIREWDSHTIEQRGKMIAAQILDNKIEAIKAFEEKVRANKKNV